MANYLFESSVCLVVFYLVFLLVFRKDPYLIRNRVYLISTLVLSMLIPLISIPSTGVVQEISNKIPLVAPDWQTGAVQVIEVSDGLNFLAIGYWTGFAVAFLYLIFRVVFIVRKIRGFEKAAIYDVDVFII